MAGNRNARKQPTQHIWHDGDAPQRPSPVEHHVFLRKVRFLLRFRNSDKLICSLFVDNASSEIKLICKKYSANVNNIYTCIRRSAWNTIGLFTSVIQLLLSYYV